METNLFVFVAALVAVTTLPAKAQVVANDLRCDGSDELQVCTGACLDEAGQPTGERCVLTDARTSTGILWDCNITHPGGVHLSCVTRETAKAFCLGLGSDWRWSERRNRCWRHREEEHTPPAPPPPPLPPPTYTGDGGMTTFSSGVAVAIPPCHPCPDCNCPAPPLPPPPGGRCTEGEIERLDAEMDRLDQNRAVLTPETGREQASELYGLAVQCGDQELATRAATLTSSFESPPPLNYSDDFDRVHSHLDEVAASIEDGDEGEESWCLDTVAGVFTCIVLPSLTAILGGALIYDYVDDGSSDIIRMFY